MGTSWLMLDSSETCSTHSAWQHIQCLQKALKILLNFNTVPSSTTPCCRSPLLPCMTILRVHVSHLAAAVMDRLGHVHNFQDHIFLVASFRKCTREHLCTQRLESDSAAEHRARSCMTGAEGGQFWKRSLG